MRLLGLIIAVRVKHAQKHNTFNISPVFVRINLEGNTVTTEPILAVKLTILSISEIVVSALAPADAPKAGNVSMLYKMNDVALIEQKDVFLNVEHNVHR